MTATAGRLYTPELLALAVELAASPLTSDLPLRGNARSRSCGSTLEMGLALDDGGTIARIGVSAAACAVGQAATALFIRSAPGKTEREIAASRDALDRWLGGSEAMPDWPEIAILRPARDHPGRHGAIMLAWNAALAALSNPAVPS
ncbi:MAG: iron-sulfur cluster assembly scaffold protein [Sphingomonadales bacterium]|nr:iron-sulfur cluster assembly scaffold protein [Sphingomonadales bacterium]MBD3773222.1 iron-sulfur cluster assembly scaffold protein [Paracoccaceae bacterium]